MSKPKTNRIVYRPPEPPRWKGKDSLDLAYQLNVRCLKLLSEMAARPNTTDWPLIAQNRELWSKLDARTIEQAARFPFVILDAHFTDVEWWRSESKPPETSQWPTSVSEQLMSETLIFAWHTAKWDRRVARLSLGMLPAVAEEIAALTPQQLSAISARHSSALRLRWQDDPDFWTQLLVAAKCDDNDRLEDVHLHAKLLLAGEIISRSAFARVPA